MKKENTLILVVLFLSIVLFLIVLLNFETLKLGSLDKFDHLVSPIAALISIYFYSKALNTSKEQNLIIISQNLKENYNTKISNLKDVSKEIVIMYEFDGIEEIKGIPFNNLFYEKVILLKANSDYREDWREFRNDNFNKDSSYFESRNYESFYFYFNPLILGHSKYINFLDEVFYLLKHIEKSNMLNQDKAHLIESILIYFLNDYTYILNLEKNQFSIPYLPNINKNEKAEFVKLFDTEFGKHKESLLKYQRIASELSNN